jgi:hypothetical protein
MNRRGKPRTLLKDFAQLGFVADIDLVKDQSDGSFLGRQADNRRDAVQGNGRAVDEIVHHDDIVFLLQQENNSVTANVTTPSSYQDGLVGRRRHGQLPQSEMSNNGNVVAADSCGFATGKSWNLRLNHESRIECRVSIASPLNLVCRSSCTPIDSV